MNKVISLILFLMEATINTFAIAYDVANIELDVGINLPVILMFMVLTFTIVSRFAESMRVDREIPSG